MVRAVAGVAGQVIQVEILTKALLTAQRDLNKALADLANKPKPRTST